MKSNLENKMTDSICLAWGRFTIPLSRIGNRRNLCCSMLPAVVLVFGLLEQRASAQSTNLVQSASDLKQMSLQELLDIEVTSVSKEPENITETPSSIQVITQDDIERSGASSIPEALRLADNLDVAQKNSHDWAISARGFNTALANKLLVMIDGRSVYTPLFSGVFWDVQDYLLEDIDQIEVISGPGGTQWGANAVNGVINITTKSAKDTQGVYMEAGGGSELRDFSGVRYGGTLASNVYFRVYGKYFDRNDEVFGDGSNATDSWNMAQGGFRVDAQQSSQNLFTLQGDYYNGDENIATGGTARVNGNNIIGRWTDTFSDEADMSLQVYYDRTHLSDPIAALLFAPAGILTDDLDTYDVDFQDHFRLGERNRFVWGLGYRFTHDEVAPAPALSFSPSILEQNLFSCFLQDEVMLHPKLHLTIGSKLEHNDYTGFEVEPSARLQWDFIPKQMLWAAVSRAVRTPSRVDRDLSEPAPPSPLILLEGSSDFVSEKVIAYELGYRAQLGPKVFTSVSSFYNVYSDIRSTSTNAPDAFGLPLPLFFQNNLEGQTYGMEFSTTYQVLDWWRLHGGYDLLKENIHVKPGEEDFNDALNETSDPQQQFQIRSSMDLTRNVDLDADLRWVDTLHNNNGPTPGTVPSYFELGTRIAWRVNKNVELSIVGQNLLHDQHTEYGFPNSDREEIVRSVYGKVACRF
jgi:iron complex outermembrane recepter protein